MRDLSTFCPLPWNHISTTSSGSYRICCSSDESCNKLVNESGQNSKIFRESFSSIRNSELLMSIRKEMLKGRQPKACRPCFEAEERGHKSPRKSYLDGFKMNLSLIQSKTEDSGSIAHESFPIQYIDIRLGNLCNLRCRMCNSWSSSSWNDEAMQIFGSENIGLIDWPSKKRKWIDEVLSHSDIQELYLTGGEPTLIEENIQLLKSLKSRNLENIRVKINSNLVYLNPDFIEVLKTFDNVLFKCSVDGLGVVNDYIRYPSRFQEIEENLRLIKKNFKFEIQTTVQSYNIFSLTSWLVWCRENLGAAPEFYLLTEPAWLDIRYLNSKYKASVLENFKRDSLDLSARDKEKLESIVGHACSKSDSSIEMDFSKYSRAMDKYRKQDIADFIPELSSL